MPGPVKRQFIFPILYIGEIVTLSCLDQGQFRFVQPIHICLVVAIVVNSECIGTYNGFKRLIRVWQRWQAMLAGRDIAP